MMALPTPETDAEIHRVTWEGGKVTEHHAVSKDFARKLERERDDLQNAISGLCGHLQIQPAGATFLAVEILRIQRQRNEMAEILRDILAYDKGEKPHDYWALQNQAEAITMAFDAWEEILRKIKQATETKP
ncbi:MAG: hypothetical protein NTV52_02905 [Acidobacteria bacterium]|nr:hypothetical protein [Acidobacteriota bacterium]